VMETANSVSFLAFVRADTRGSRMAAMGSRAAIQDASHPEADARRQRLTKG
jgi:hypothetical protein